MSFGASMKGEAKDVSFRYIDWLLTPEELRVPKTMKALAAQLGVTDQTLRNYRKEPVFQREMAERARGAAKVEKLPEILEALFRTAISPSPQQPAAAKLLLDFMEKAAPAQVIDASKLTPEELRAVALEALSKLGTADG